jgi:hypothetical protein
MATWTSGELDKIGAADELRIAPRRPDGALGKELPIWVVRQGDDLYIRSFKGNGGAWFRGATATHEGHVNAGGVAKDVVFEEIGDPGVNDQIDAVYGEKYQRFGSGYVDPMLTPTARGATLKLVPR